MTLEQRVEALEKTSGQGVKHNMVEMIVANIDDGGAMTEAGIAACGQTWERQTGESDKSLQARAVEGLLEKDTRALIREAMALYAELIEARTCTSRY